MNVPFLKTASSSYLKDDSPLHATVFAKHAMLLAADSGGKVLRAQLLERPNTVQASTLSDVTVGIDHRNGHPSASGEAGSCDDKRFYLNYAPTDDSPAELLSGGPHSAVAWYLIGLNELDNELDTLSPSVGGLGLFGVGAILDDTQLESDGRMWLKWTCDPLTLQGNMELPFGLADADGNPVKVYTAETKAYSDRDHVNPVSGWIKVIERSEAPGVAFSAERLFDGQAAAAQSREQRLFERNQRLHERAMELLEAQWGPDPMTPNEVFASRPPAGAVLMDAGPAPLSRFTQKLSGSPQHFNGDFLWAGEESWASMDQAFVFPEGPEQGLKLTVAIRNSGRTLADAAIGTLGNQFSLGMYREGQDPTKETPVLEVMRNHQNSGNNFVGGIHGVARAQWTQDYNNGFSYRDPLSGVEPSIYNGQTYEIFVCPDGRGYIYAEGIFINHFFLHAKQVEQGDQYRFALGLRYANVSMTALKVESFTVPQDYPTYAGPGHLASANIWKTEYPYYNSKYALESNQETYSNSPGQMVGLNANSGHLVEFSATHPLKLEVCVRYAYRYQSPSDGEVLVLESLDGSYTKSFRVGDFSYSWETLEDNLPSGRYRLKAADGAHFRFSGWRSSDPVVPADPEPESTPTE